MWVQEVTRWIYGYVWLAPVPPVVWYLQRTRTLRTVATVIRGEVRDRWLRAKGVPEATRHELCRRGLGHRLVLLAGASAHAHSPDDAAIAAQRDTPGEDHDPPVVRPMDPEELLAGLGVRVTLSRS